MGEKQPQTVRNCMPQAPLLMGSTVKVCYRRFGSKNHLPLVVTGALVLVFHYHARYWVHLILAVFNLLNMLLNTRHKATISS